MLSVYWDTRHTETQTQADTDRHTLRAWRRLYLPTNPGRQELPKVGVTKIVLETFVRSR